MTRNITPWIVLVHSSCGVRRNLSRLRLAITSVLDARDARAAATATALAMTNLPWDATRERQERLVEPRRAQRHLLEGDPALLERQQGAVELLGAALHRHGDPVGRRIDLRLAVADRGEGLGDLGEVAAVADVDLDHVAPRALLQLGGRAVRDGPAVGGDHDPVGEPVGLVPVLRAEQHVRPLLDELADRLPQVDAASWVQPGGRLVEQQQAWRADQARAQVELA